MGVDESPPGFISSKASSLWGSRPLASGADIPLLDVNELPEEGNVPTLGRASSLPSPGTALLCGGFSAMSAKTNAQEKHKQAVPSGGWYTPSQ